ncbi:MAG: LegC2/C7 family Dot/Icm T4SS effector [Legionella sp.]
MDRNAVEMQLLLPQDDLSDENDQLPTYSEIKDDAERLKALLADKEELVKVKESFCAVIDSMHDNPSLITRCAEYWGKLPMWQKVGGGVALTIPTLIIGLAAHIGILLAFSGFTVIAYSAGGIVLGDHYSSNKNMADKLKKGILGLADILVALINQLHSICDSLHVENDRFHRENELLAETRSSLQDTVATLTTQAENYILISDFLKKEQLKLEKTNITLAHTATELEAVKSELAKNQSLLAAKIGELERVRVEMGLDLDKAKQTASILNSTVTALAQTSIASDEQRQELQEKIQLIMDGKMEQFGEVAERLSATEEQLAIAKNELEQKNNYYAGLLERYEKLIERQEDLFRRYSETELTNMEEQKPPSISNNMHSLYASRAQFLGEQFKFNSYKADELSFEIND